MTAIDYPTIAVGSRTLIVRYSIASQVLLRRRGIDPGKIRESIASNNPEGVQNLLTLFSACVAENFLDKSDPSAVNLSLTPTADYWASELDQRQFGEMNQKVLDALEKAREAMQMARPAPPPNP